MKLMAEGWSSRVRRHALDLGLYGQSTYTPFVLVGRSRVGSNLLRGLLNGHPQVEMFGEIFRDTREVDWDHLGYFQTPAIRALARCDPVRLVDRKVFGRYPDAVRAVGFKLFYYHARQGVEANVWPYLRDRRDVRILHLRRENLLQTHFSRKRAALTDRWVNVSGQPDAQVEVQLDYGECLEDFERTRAWEAEAVRFFDRHPIYEATYERLAADPQREADQIQRFLRVPVHPVQPSTYQQTRQPLSVAIANYAELKACFSGTTWESFFTD